MSGELPKSILVIPCYNEERRLDVDEIGRYLRSIEELDLCFVNDGSTDGTYDLLSQLSAVFPRRVLTVDLKANQGKAEAVRQGFLAVLNWKTSDYIGYWDADLAVPLAEFDYMFRFVRMSGIQLPSILMGARIRRLGADIIRKWWRHYLGRVFATITSIILRIPVYDTQCGAKLIKTEVCYALFSEPFLSRWIFDVELLSRFNQSYGPMAESEIVEIPLRAWHEREGSKIRAGNFFRAAWDLYLIWREIRKRN